VTLCGGLLDIDCSKPVGRTVLEIGTGKKTSTRKVIGFRYIDHKTGQTMDLIPTGFAWD
jgi:hypothetical protein